MDERHLSTSVRSFSSGIVGRSLNTIRNHHLIIDSPSLNEEITSGESFLAGLSSCGVNLVEAAARDTGVPLRRMDVSIEGLRAPDNPSWFEQVNMRFELVGVDSEQAEALVQRYKDG
jgi:uncharacterized OsmC-like protein